MAGKNPKVCHFSWQPDDITHHDLLLLFSHVLQDVNEYEHKTSAQSSMEFKREKLATNFKGEDHSFPWSYYNHYQQPSYKNQTMPIEFPTVIVLLLIVCSRLFIVAFPWLIYKIKKMKKKMKKSTTKS